MLLKTIAELKKYVGALQGNLNFQTLESSIRQAEFKFLIPVLGQDFWQELDTAYQANTLSAAQTDLLPLVQQPLACFAVLEAVPFLSLQMGDGGIVELSSQNTQAPRQFLLQELKAALVDSADQGLEALLVYLEDHADTFPTWKASKARGKTAGLVVRNSEELESYGHLSPGRRAFLKLVPFLKEAELMHLEPLLGTQLYTRLQDWRKNGSTDSKAQCLLTYCQPVVALYALAEALPNLNFAKVDSGLRLISESYGVYGVKTSVPIPREEAVAMSLAIQNRARLYAEKLLQYLAANLSDYPEYTPPSGPSFASLPDNSGAGTLFIV